MPGTNEQIDTRNGVNYDLVGSAPHDEPAGTRMKSMTIHDLGDPLSRRLAMEAQRRGTSLNRLIKSLLADRLGLTAERQDHRADFLDLFAAWSKGDREAFEKNTKGFEEIDRDDWR
jgi:hypothetical protein